MALTCGYSISYAYRAVPAGDVSFHNSLDVTLRDLAWKHFAGVAIAESTRKSAYVQRTELLSGTILLASCTVCT
jgi:hypothetical protein